MEEHLNRFLLSEQADLLSTWGKSVHNSNLITEEGQFSLAGLSDASRRLINLVLTTPDVLQKFIENPEAAWLQFGANISEAEKRKLEMLAAMFLSGEGLIVIPVTNEGVWTGPSPA